MIIHQITEYLLAPSVQRFPIPYRSKTTLYLIRIYDSPSGNNSTAFQWKKIEDEVAFKKIMNQTFGKFTHFNF